MQRDTTMTWLPIAALRGHPMNANIMPDDKFNKLVGHIERTGQYPPLIVREVAAGAYELLDGHHRCKALERLGHAHALCAVWSDVDDTQAILLLTTLNRLEGADDPRKRGMLLDKLQQNLDGDLAKLARYVPESPEQVKKLIDTVGELPEPLPPPDLTEMPYPVCFFLKGYEAERLRNVLERIGGEREQALMRMVDREQSISEGGA